METRLTFTGPNLEVLDMNRHIEGCTGEWRVNASDFERSSGKPIWKHVTPRRCALRRTHHFIVVVRILELPMTATSHNKNNSGLPSQSQYMRFTSLTH
jgi:hypothetical protein